MLIKWLCCGGEINSLLGQQIWNKSKLHISSSMALDRLWNLRESHCHGNPGGLVLRVKEGYKYNDLP